MIKWIRNLLGLCDHTWEEFRQVNHRDGDQKHKPIVGIVYVLRCSKCGTLKNHKVFY